MLWSHFWEGSTATNLSEKYICLALIYDFYYVEFIFQEHSQCYYHQYHQLCLGREGGRLFALAIGGSTNKSLKGVHLRNNNIDEDGMVDIITALSIYPHLEHLDLIGNHLGKNGCVALATLLRCSATKLQHLYYLANTEINDEGIEALVPELTTCNRLEVLDLWNNRSITTQGWQSLATILEAPYSILEVLDTSRSTVDDEAVTSFANALSNNHTLHIFELGNSHYSCWMAGLL